MVAIRNTLKYIGRSEDGSTLYPTSYNIESIRIKTIYKISEKTIPCPLPTINIIGGKRPLRDRNNLGLYKKTLKSSSLEKYKEKSLREY